LGRGVKRDSENCPIFHELPNGLYTISYLKNTVIEDEDEDEEEHEYEYEAMPKFFLVLVLVVVLVFGIFKMGSSG